MKMHELSKYKCYSNQLNINNLKNIIIPMDGLFMQSTVLELNVSRCPNSCPILGVLGKKVEFEYSTLREKAIHGDFFFLQIVKV